MVVFKSKCLSGKKAHTFLPFFLMSIWILFSCESSRHKAIDPLRPIDSCLIAVNKDFKPSITPRFISVTENYIFVLTWRPSGLFKFSRQGQLINVVDIENIVDSNFYSDQLRDVNAYHDTYGDYIIEALDRDFVKISQFNIVNDCIVGFGYALFPTKRVIDFNGQKAINKEFIKCSFMVYLNFDMEHIETVLLDRLNRSMTSAYINKDTIANALDFMAKDSLYDRIRVFTRTNDEFVLRELPKNLRRIVRFSSIRALMKDGSSYYANVSFLNNGRTIVSENKAYFLNGSLLGVIKDSIIFKDPILGVLSNKNGALVIHGVPIPNDTLLKSQISYYDADGKMSSRFLDYNVHLSNTYVDGDKLFIFRKMDINYRLESYELP